MTLQLTAEPEPFGSSNRALRIAIVIDSLRIGGAERVVVQEAAARDPKRLHYEIIGLTPVDLNPGRGFAAELTRVGVPFETLPGRLMDPRRTVRLAGVLRRMNPDVVHTHLTYSNIIGLVAARLAGIPAVASIHSSVMAAEQERGAPWKELLEALVVRTLARRVIVVAESLRMPIARAKRLTLANVIAMPNAVDPTMIRVPGDFDVASTRLALGVPESHRAIAVVGRLAPPKGHAVLLEAASALVKQGLTNVTYLFAGQGPSEDAIRQRASDLGLSEAVRFLGTASNVNAVLGASDLYVQASLNEGLSQALLEAGLLGAPIVATSVGGTADIVEDGVTGWLVPAGRAQPLAHAIADALSRPEEARSRAAAARARIQAGFITTVRLERLEALYRSVIGESGTGGG